ncbi:hypothetical protein [Hufsiella ginkgonis]|uniref:Outer membrane beta-barrel protein n=1 Tax=Hufsiella ginkgonis TaxID=2695274 RepID=A0A7K1XYD7_9SPHI|nr:hypothetical protein [Hufsiella ginkgonis]MXV16011.1 hypothetical protein [Hufsiella ginkgonis]
MKKQRIILVTSGIFFFFLSLPSKSYGQQHTVDAGLRFQKAVGLYYENGLTAQYNYSRRWVFGVSYITSRLGSASRSNAIKQDNFLISGAYLFKAAAALNPFVRANTGYFRADYETEIFNRLPKSSVLLSADAGLMYRFKFPLKMNVSIGYNAITGDGESGPGTLYPLFYQLSALWNLGKHQAK